MSNRPLKLSTATFIEKARELHGDHYDYSKAQYLGVNVKTTIICPTHGPWLQTPSNHLHKTSPRGCPECGKLRTAKSFKLSQKDFITRCKKAHGDKYDLSQVVYKNAQTAITVICPKHGAFSTVPVNFAWHGKGCQQCAYEARRGIFKYSLKDLVYRAKQLMPDIDFSHVRSALIKGEPNKFVCPEHGEFFKDWDKILRGYGCPVCASSAQERVLYSWAANRWEVSHRNRKVCNAEIDVYIPKHKVGIELHGLYYHSELFQSTLYHRYKAEEADKAGIKLFQIWEHDFWNKAGIIKSMIKVACGEAKYKYNAREAKLIKVNTPAAQYFLQHNHIQGFAHCSVFVGLKYQKQLIAVMGFSKRFQQDNTWELVRFATLRHSIVRGGASRLLTAFERKYNPAAIVSLADRMYSNGGLYKQLGFDLIRKAKPSYFWYSQKHGVLSRYKTRRKQIPRLIDCFNPQLSEGENMRAAGYIKVFNAGHLVFKKTYGELND